VVAIVHGMGVHPDWGLINPLRSGLAEQGYATLSVQMPVLAADADGSQYRPLYPEASARLGAAVQFLRNRGAGKVAIVSHSLGARMANHYFSSDADAAAVDAWVAIGLSGEVSKPETLKTPTLDLYGERDLPAVLDYAGKRAAVLRKIRGSAQAEIAGADHFFNGREAELVKHVKLFLDRALK
jgi:predicted alpha/beta-hydrolase family hydrolase